MYNEDLASKPQPKREVDNARKLFVDAVKQMEKDGAINLEDILSGGEMIE
jgi:flagellar motor switch protein FliG